MYRVLIASLLAAVSTASGPAVAAESAPPPNPTVLMSPLALPIVVDGRLVNFVFVTLRLGLLPSGDIPKLRAKEPYFRDALVHAAYRAPLVRDDNYAAVDDERMRAMMLRAAASVVGPGQVISVQVIKELPQHTDGLPKPKTAPQGR